jgi:4-hydroxybenzoyl-CoA reductase subunit beta
MRLPRFEYVRPKTIDEALSVLDQRGEKARILAGGTDLLVNMKYRVVCPDIVISIKSIPEMSAVLSESSGYTSIGSCANLSDLVNNKSISNKFPALAKAFRSVASKHIRDMASIGGNICLGTRCWYYNQSKLWREARQRCHRTGGEVCHAIKGAGRCYAINSSDTAPVLVSLAANIEVIKKGMRRLVPVQEFYRDDGIRHTALGPSEMVSSIQIPDENGNASGAFAKLSMRKGIDFAMASVAARVISDGRRVLNARIVAGSISSAPILLHKASQVIMESGLTEKSIAQAAAAARGEIGITTNLFTSAGYKRQLIDVLVKRTLNELKEKTQQNRRGNA